METKLTNVHEAMSEAVQESREEGVMVGVSFRLDPTVKALAEDLCARHGISLSRYLRRCCVALVRDYSPNQ